MPSLLAIVCLFLVPSVVKACHLTWKYPLKATSNGGSLYFTNLNSIELLSNNLSTVVLGGLEHAESLDCNVCDQRIYWVDMLGKIKKGIPNNQSSIEVVVDKDLRRPIGLAVDWKGNNVYFSDTRNVQGQGRVEVTSCNGRQRKVLLHKLDSPGPLALNLLTGYLYIGDFLTIKRIPADGSGNPQDVYSEFFAIKGLAIDVTNNFLYWTVERDIKYLNMTHWETLTETERPSIFPEPVDKGFEGAIPHGISVINNTIYWTEDRELSQENPRITRPGAIYSLSLPTNTAQRLLQNDSLSPQDISTFINISVHHDGCANNNGNCQHFCFTVPDGNGGTRPQCGCPTGITDNRTCPEVPQEFLIFTQNFDNRTEIHQISLDIPGKYIDTLVPIDNLSKNVFFLSYDLVFHQIYWAEVNPPAIKRAYVNGSSVETFIGTGLKHPEGIAVDSYSRNLYWVDSDLNRIEVARLSDSKNRRMLFSDELDHPQGLALDLNNKYMYWTDLGSSGPKIERARMDGTGRMNLPDVRYTIKTPTNIAVDPLTGWVYWSEIDSEVERVSRYDGSQDFSLSLSRIGEVFGLAIHGDYLYWTDRSATQRALVRARKSSGHEERVVLAGYAGLLGLVAVNSSVVPAPTGCHFSYGNCEQLCLPSGSAHTCSCRDNFIIEGNQCEVVDCGTPTNPVSGQVSHPTGTTFGQDATYRCDTGYNLVGNNTRTCQATGVWSGSTPTCQVLPIMFTLDVQIRDVTFGDSANFVCCTNSTGITLHWEIQQMENNYRDCNDSAFCVRNTPQVNSVCSTLEIDTTQLNRTQSIVQCIVEQTLGGQTSRNISTGQLTVRNIPFSNMPPRFNTEPQDTVVFATDAAGNISSLTLNCSALGNPSPDITWFREGLPLINEIINSNGTLLIMNITEGVDATRGGVSYHCTANNTFGTIRSRAANVSYAYFDGFDGPNGTVTVTVTTDDGDDNVALECHAQAANPPPQIMWLGNGMPLTEDRNNNRLRFLDSGHYLLIRQLGTAQVNTNYRCEVTNARLHETVTSPTIYDLVPNLGSNEYMIYKELINKTIQVGNTVEFSYIAGAGRGIVPFGLDDCERSGSTLTRDISLADDVGGVILDNVTREMIPQVADSVTFEVSCTLFSGANSSLSQATLTVHAHPMITRMPAFDLEQLIGQSVSFTCVVSGVPTPTVTWYHNGAQLSTGGEILISRNCPNVSVLFLSSLAVNQTGMYQCFASNVVGRTQASWALQVRISALPFIVNLPAPMNHTVGDRFILMCSFIGTPPPVVGWQKDGSVFLPREGRSIMNNTGWSQLVINSLALSDAGVYSCSVTNDAGTDTRSVRLEVRAMPPTSISQPGADLVTVLPAVLVPACAVLIVGAVTAVVCVMRRRQNVAVKSMDGVDMTSVNREETGAVSPDDQQSVDLVDMLPNNMIIPSGMLKFLGNIGQGEFGLVFKAHLKWHRTAETEIVAVKTLKGLGTPNDIHNLEEEVLKMQYFKHPNVMSLIGVCENFCGGPAVVMPFMANGSVLDYLRRERKSLVLCAEAEKSMISHVQSVLLGMCLQIAKGMEYIADQKIVHRDLAARNCMIDASGVIKVADFGLAEDVYSANYYRWKKGDTNMKLPIRWMSPESIRDGVFTEKSDVWSFGVTSWEVFTGGTIPYGGIGPLVLLQLLCDGERLSKPSNSACTDEIYSLLLHCWDEQPEKRPSFSEQVVTIATMMEAVGGYLSLNVTDKINLAAEPHLLYYNLDTAF